MIYCFDIDGVICDTPGLDYAAAVPRPEVIDRINALKIAGHRVIYYTGRGSSSKRDYTPLTLKQFKTWGVLYDELCFGKPAADIYVDDKAVGFNDWKENRG